jgi:hypothetical protein
VIRRSFFAALLAPFTTLAAAPQKKKRKAKPKPPQAMYPYDYPLRVGEPLRVGSTVYIRKPQRLVLT